MPKITLRDLFLLVTLVAVLVAWWVEYNHRNSIVGAWYFSDVGSARNHETLTIGRDGAFTKTQQRGSASVTYGGTYAIAEDGLVTFHVTSKHVKFHVKSKQVESYVNKFPAETFDVEAVFRCRCAIDDEGVLIVTDLDQPRPGHDRGYTPATPVDIYLFATRCYTSVSHAAQNQATLGDVSGAAMSPQP